MFEVRIKKKNLSIVSNGLPCQVRTKAALKNTKPSEKAINHKQFSESRSIRVLSTPQRRYCKISINMQINMP